MNDTSYIQWHAISDNAISKQIGKFVRQHRMEQNKTQDALAKDAGISRSTLSLLERGETVTLPTLIQVLRVLDKLQVLDAFAVVKQPSPLQLARAERKNRQRASGSRKSTDTETNTSDW